MGQEQISTGEEGSVASVEPVETNSGQEGGGDSLNPAWSELLGVVPSDLHSQVTPHLQEWDKNFQTKINEVHSQYAPYKPLVESQVPYEQIQYAMSVMQAIDSEPLKVIEALQNYAKANGLLQEELSGTEQQGQVDETEIPEEWLKHPAIQQMQQQIQTVAQFLVQQETAKSDSAEDAKLQSELETLRQQHGEYDEEWVLTRALNNPDAKLEDHVKAYKQFEQGIIAKQRQPGPKVMGGGGVAPDNQVDVKALDDKGRRAYIASLLQGANQQSQ